MQSMQQNVQIPRVLVVDDEQTIVTSIVRALELRDFERMEPPPAKRR